MADGEEYYYEEETHEEQDDQEGVDEEPEEKGAAGLLNFCYMLLLLIGLGHWSVSAAPLIITYQFKTLRSLPVALAFAVMFFGCIAAWGAAFMGFGLNYFELPPCTHGFEFHLQ